MLFAGHDGGFGGLGRNIIFTTDTAETKLTGIWGRYRGESSSDFKRVCQLLIPFFLEVLRKWS